MNFTIIGVLLIMVIAVTVVAVGLIPWWVIALCVILAIVLWYLFGREEEEEPLYKRIIRYKQV